MADGTEDARGRLNVKKRTLDDAYAAPANFLEIDLIDPITHEIGNNKITDYEIRMRTNLPGYKVIESIRRRYSEFEWLRDELERDSKILVPPLPDRRWKDRSLLRRYNGLFEGRFVEERRKGLADRRWKHRSLLGPFDGLFEERFIEERRKGLEIFINKIAVQPLAQNERCLHMFLQERFIDKNYVPGKINA